MSKFTRRTRSKVSFSDGALSLLEKCLPSDLISSNGANNFCLFKSN